MEKMEIDLRNTLFSYISRSHHLGAVFVDDQLSKRGIKNLAYSHVRIIILLNIYKRLSMKDISERIFKDKSTVTILVNKLVKLGYVRKEGCSQDKRVVYLTLEKKAEEVIESVFNVSEIFQDKVESILDEKEIETLFKIMKKLVDNF